MDKKILEEKLLLSDKRSNHFKPKIKYNTKRIAECSVFTKWIYLSKEAFESEDQNLLQFLYSHELSHIEMFWENFRKHLCFIISKSFFIILTILCDIISDSLNKDNLIRKKYRIKNFILVKVNLNNKIFRKMHIYWVASAIYEIKCDILAVFNNGLSEQQINKAMDLMEEICNNPKIKIMNYKSGYPPSDLRKRIVIDNCSLSNGISKEIIEIIVKDFCITINEIQFYDECLILILERLRKSNIFSES